MGPLSSTRRPGGSKANVRTYAQIAAIFLLAVAAFGFFTWEWRVVSTFYHAGVGFLFLYVGFVPEDPIVVRRMVGGLGVLLLVVKAATILTPLAWRGDPLHGPIEVTCLAVGISSVLAARYLRGGEPAGGGR